MERYESLCLVGEGSYGTVLKCRHRQSGRLVAIKKFMDSDDDKTVKKIALREIKLLRQLRHDNLVNLLEVWRRRRRWYLVFEFVDRTLLDDLEQNPSGLEPATSRQYLYQILRAAAFCHKHNIIHRDIKPENILISQGGVVKLCDFGFARTMALPAEGGIYTDYVATRWYRAPELLVGDAKYGKPVDVWALGCLFVEMLTGQPLFPGDSDLDQIYHIVRFFGDLTAHHQALFYRNPVFSGIRLPECSSMVSLERRFPAVSPSALDLAQGCLQKDPERRAQCSELLEHLLFTHDSFHIRFMDELNAEIQRYHRENSTLPTLSKAPRQDRDEEDHLRGTDATIPEDVEEVLKDKEKKTKGKKPSKSSKSIRNTSEPLRSTKPKSKTLGAKINDIAAKRTATMKSKPGKAGVDLREEPEVSRTRRLTSGSSEDLDKDQTTADPPEDGDLENMGTRYSGGLYSSCSHTTRSKENTVKSKPWRSSYSEPSRDFRRRCNEADGNKLSQSSTTRYQNWSSSPKASVDGTDDPLITAVTKTPSDPNSLPETRPLDLPARSTDHLEVPKTGKSKSSKTRSSSIFKPTNGSTGAFDKPSKVLPADREHAEGLNTTRNKQQSCKNIRQDQQSTSTIPPGSRRSSLLREVPKASTLGETSFPKTPNVSDKENADDSGVSVSVNQTSLVSRRPSDAWRTNSRPADHKTFTEVRKKSDTTGLSIIAGTSNTPSHTADLHELDSRDNKASSPPPPCSSPLLPPPSSTPLIPWLSAVTTNSPAASDHLRLPPQTHSFRSVNKSRRHSGVYSRVSRHPGSSHITGSLAAQAMERSLTCERFIPSDRCTRMNTGGVTVPDRKSDVHFPELKSSTLQELRGREGKYNRRRSHKPPSSSGAPSEDQQHRPDTSST